MPVTTYSTLATQIQETAENTGSEFVDSIPNFISRTENRLTRDVDLLRLTRLDKFCHNKLYCLDPCLPEAT
jgi:hypothetical protein